MNAITLGMLLLEVEKWTTKYEFSFQFWGEGQNNVFIDRDDIRLADFGGYDTIEKVLVSALQWIYKVNRTPNEDRIMWKIQNDI